MNTVYSRTLLQFDVVVPVETSSSLHLAVHPVRQASEAASQPASHGGGWEWWLNHFSEAWLAGSEACLAGFWPLGGMD